MSLVKSKIIIGLVCLLSMLLFFHPESEAVYITIENIGGSPITAAVFTFDVEPFQGGFDFQLGSSRWKEDPSNIYFEFDESNPIAVGETYTTPLIPEITGVNFNLEGVGISGFNIFVGASGPLLVPVVPDVSSYTEFNSDINFGYTVSFFSGGEPIPEPITVIFEDDFNTENGGNYKYNWDSFANWIVTDGAVDIINSNHYGFEHLGAYGIFIDLDGTGSPGAAGRIESKTAFSFYPGYIYELSFDLAGSQAFWLPHPNTVTVSLGSIYSQDITLDTYDPFQTFQHTFQVTSPVSASLVFDHWGGDWVGLLLDNVKITSASICESVEIDIKPGSDPNSINPKSKGKIPVAILSTTDFYASDDVETESLTFGTTGDEESLAFCNPSPEDVNDDGYDDLVCHFYTQMTGFDCGDEEGILKGQTMEGDPIEGSDSVRIVPCR